MKVSVDRIETGIATLLSCKDPGIRFTVPVVDLPPGCRENDILTITFVRDDAATAAAQERAGILVARLRKREG